MQKLSFWIKQMGNPDEEHEEVIAIISGTIGALAISVTFWWLVLTTY